MIGARLQPKPLSGRDGALAACRIEIERGRFHVGHDRCRAAERHHFGRGAESESGTDDGIARSDAPRHQHEAKRIGATRTDNGVPRAAECREFGLQRPHLGSLDELAMCQHPGNRIVDGAAEPAALRGDVNERDRPLVEAGMLIHENIRTRFGSIAACDESGLADNAARPFALRHA